MVKECINVTNKEMTLVPFKKNQLFLTRDEAKEYADKDKNHDGFSVCTDAFPDAGSDVTPSYLDVTKRSLYISNHFGR